MQGMATKVASEKANTQREIIFFISLLPVQAVGLVHGFPAFWRF
jgi:nitrate reductase NapE component